MSREQSVSYPAVWVVNLIPVGHGIVEIIANKIREKGILPYDERNDSLILAEASLIGASVLITSDEHFLSIKSVQDKLRFLLDTHHVHHPIIVSPFDIIRQFFH